MKSPFGTPALRRSAATLSGITLMVAFAACGGDDPAGTPPSSVPEAGPTASPDTGAPPPPDGGDASTGPVDPAAQSGSRLRRRYLEAASGAQQSIDFWDTKLGVACSFMRAKDGEYRCLPDEPAEVFFTQPSCSGEAVMVPDEACSVMYGRRGDVYFHRTTATRTFEAGDQVYYPSGSGCQGLFVRPSERTSNVAELVPSSAFVRGSERDEPRSDGMVARYVDGDDGSKFLLSTRDAARDRECDFDSEPGRCVPARRQGVGTLFANASCTEAVGAMTASFVDSLFEHPNFAADGCVAGSDYFEVGAKLAVDAPLYHRDAGGTCVTTARQVGQDYYLVGDAVPISSFPEIKIALEGSGAMKLRRRTDVDGAPLGQAFAFWETAKDRACVALSNGEEYRCVTRNQGLVSRSVFADAACTTTSVGQFSCDPEPGDILEVGGSACLPGIFRMNRAYERGPAATALYRSAGGTCTEYEGRGARFYSLGPAIDAATLPLLELKTE